MTFRFARDPRAEKGWAATAALPLKNRLAPMRTERYPQPHVTSPKLTAPRDTPNVTLSLSKGERSCA